MWVREPGPRDQPPREVWWDDGEPLSRYDYLTIIVRGYTDMGMRAPQPILAEYNALVAERVAELRRRMDEQLRSQLNWKPRPFSFLDVTNC